MKLKNLEYRSLWYKKLYYYLDSGQSISEAAKIAASDIDTQYIYQELIEGVNLSHILTLDNLKICFSSTEKSLISIAEKTGSMKEVFYSLSILLKSRHIQRQTLLAAIMYPCLILLMASGLLLMILIVIVPKIGPLFSAMKELPITTKFLISLSDHIIYRWYIDLMVITGMYVIHSWLKRKNWYLSILKNIKDRICQRMIFIKDIYTLWHIEKYMHVIHISLSSNIAIADALLYATESVDDISFKKYFLQVQQDVARGNTCSSAMDQLPQFLHKKIKDWIYSSQRNYSGLESILEIDLVDV